MSELYELCPICRGSNSCLTCKQVSVVEASLTTEQFDALRERLEDVSLLLQAIIRVTVRGLTLDDSGRTRKRSHQISLGADGLVRPFSAELLEHLREAVR